MLLVPTLGKLWVIQYLQQDTAWVERDDARRWKTESGAKERKSESDKREERQKVTKERKTESDKREEDRK